MAQKCSEANKPKPAPVFVIIRFPINRALACKNSLMKNLSIHHNYSGDVSGISKAVSVAEGDWPQNKGIVILSFQSLREAELWKDSVPEIRQQDWLDGVDMIIAPVRSMPPENKRFVQLLDLRFKDINGYMSEMSASIDKFLQESGASPGVVSACADNLHKVKGLWDPAYLVLNFWPDARTFEEAYNSEKFREIREKRVEFALANSCVFHLESLKDKPCG